MTEKVVQLVDDNLAAMSLSRMQCHIAMAEGDFRRARALFNPPEREFSSGMARARNELQALHVLLDVEAGQVPNPVFVEDLKQSHLRARTAGKQDWLVAALIGALRASSQDADADALSQQYLETYRRERYPFPQYLQRFIGSSE